jgi:hypothetical protein
MENPPFLGQQTGCRFSMTKEFLGLTACQSTRDPGAKPPFSPSSIVSSDWKSVVRSGNFGTHFQLVPRRALAMY